MPVLSKEFLDIGATIECRFALKRVRNMIRAYRQILLFMYSYVSGVQLPAITSVELNMPPKKIKWKDERILRFLTTLFYKQSKKLNNHRRSI